MMQCVRPESELEGEIPTDRSDPLIIQMMFKRVARALLHVAEHAKQAVVNFAQALNLCAILSGELP
jgi:hypothetical protein